MKTFKLFVNSAILAVLLISGAGSALSKLPLSPTSAPSDLRCYVESVEKMRSPAAEELLMQANAYSWLKDNKSAIKSINKVLDLRPNSGVAYTFRALMYKREYKLPESLADFNKAEQLGYHRPNLYAERGRVKLELNDLPGALSDGKKASALEPSNAMNFDLLGVVEYKLGNFEAGIGSYTKAINLDPNDGNAYAGRSLIYKRLKKNKEASADAERAHALGWKEIVD